MSIIEKIQKVNPDFLKDLEEKIDIIENSSTNSSVRKIFDITRKSKFFFVEKTKNMFYMEMENNLVEKVIDVFKNEGVYYILNNGHKYTSITFDYDKDFIYHYNILVYLFSKNIKRNTSLCIEYE